MSGIHFQTFKATKTAIIRDRIQGWLNELNSRMKVVFGTNGGNWTCSDNISMANFQENVDFDPQD